MQDYGWIMKMRTVEQLAVAKNVLSRLLVISLKPRRTWERPYFVTWLYKGRCSSVVLPTSLVGFRGDLFLLEARRAPMRSPQPSPAVRASVTCREWEDSSTIIETCGKVRDTLSIRRQKCCYVRQKLSSPRIRSRQSYSTRGACSSVWKGQLSVRDGVNAPKSQQKRSS